jgi:glycosyltransferase involved in cell wall biosynthesis
MQKKIVILHTEKQRHTNNSYLQMKILFISPHFYSFKHVNGGSEQRTYLLLKALTRFAEVDFVAFHDAAGFDQLPINVLFQQDLGSGKIPSKWGKWLPVLKFWDKEMIFPIHRKKAEIIREIVKSTDYDCIITRYIPKAMECDLLRFAEKLVVDVDDLPEDYYKIMAENSASRSGKVRYALLSKIAKIHTKHFLRKIQKFSFPNPYTAQKFSGIYLPNIPFYENKCTDIDFSKTKKRLFFIGNLTYEPNFGGVDYFLKNIYLPLYEKDNEIEFYIGGRMRDNSLKEKWKSYPNIQVLGFVDDLTAEYEKSRVVVVPIYQGAGTNIKVIEALQMNRACAVSEFAARGFADIFEDKKDYFVAHTDEEYVEILERLLTDEALNRATAENSNSKVKQYFSFELFVEKVKTLVEKEY